MAGGRRLRESARAGEWPAQRETEVNFDYSEADEYDADFIAAGKIEFEELDDEETPAELMVLAARVRAARSWGA